jgi:hypothetical protein
VSKKRRQLEPPAEDQWFLPMVAYGDVEVRIAEMQRAVAAGRRVSNRMRCPFGT